MAIITPGPTVASISGSIGGTTYSRNRGGAYIRNRSIPVTSTTSAALAAKTRFGHAAQTWQTLSAADRDAWQFWADANPGINALGNQFRLTGSQAYVGFHVRAEVAGQTPITVPPIVSAPAALETLALTADIGLGDVEIAYTATPTGANDFLWIEAAIVNSAGINFVENLMRFIAVSGAAEASPFSIETAVVARLGTLTVGQFLHVQVAVFNDTSMRLSGFLKSSVIVTTT